MSIKVAVHGASGRMGQRILALAGQFPQLEITAAVVSQQSQFLAKNCDLSGDSKLKYSCDISAALSGCDVVVDFSERSASLSMLEVAKELGKALVIGTTGYAESDLEKIREASRTVPILLAANFSLGLNLLRKLSKLSAGILGEDFQVELLEIHHGAKKDAPSGSALKIAADLQQLRPELEVATDRSKRLAVRPASELGISSLRGGNVSGEHRVFFLGNDERLELCHSVSDRSVFARGALRMCILLAAKPPGLYDILDLL